MYVKTDRRGFLNFDLPPEILTEGVTPQMFLDG
jgi:hypothetical protein